jgi:microcystin-dependent protein
MNLFLKNRSYIIIIIFIILAIIILCNTKTITNEKFIELTEDQIIEGNYKVRINNTDNVLFGTEDNNTSLKKILAALQNTNNTNMSDIANLKTTLSGHTTDISNIKSMLANFNTVISNIGTMKSYMDTTTAKITDISDTINNNQFNYVPELTIMPYTGNLNYNGWQLCDGSPLLYSSTPTSSNNKVLASDTRFKNMKNVNGVIMTPDLRGRFILGAGAGTGLTARGINDMGGKETHILTKDEMPTHNHGNDMNTTENSDIFPYLNKNRYGAMYANACLKTGGGGGGAGGGGGLTPDGGWWHQTCPQLHQHQFEGKNLPHPVMPPYYTLVYIIKQPKQ